MREHIAASIPTTLLTSLRPDTPANAEHTTRRINHNYSPTKIPKPMKSL